MHAYTNNFNNDAVHIYDLNLIMKLYTSNQLVHSGKQFLQCIYNVVEKTFTFI